MLANFLKHRGFFAQLLRLAVPVAIQSMLVSILNMVDVLMVGFLGSEAIAAVGLGSKIHFVAILVMAGIATGCSVLVAQYWGKSDHQGARAVVSLAMVTGVLLLTPITLFLMVFATELYELANNDAQVTLQGAEYLWLTAPTLIATHFIIVYEGGLRSLGQTILPLVFAALAIALNIALNYALIGGHWGAPELGVAGAAYATDISRVFQVILLVGFIWWRQHPLKLRWQDLQNGLAPEQLSRFAQVTWPLVVNFTLWSVGSFCYHLIAGRLGTEPLAVISLMTPIESLYHSLFFGLSSACSIMIGHRLGRDEFQVAKQLAQFFVIVGPILSFLLGVVIVLNKQLIFGLFGDIDSETLHLANQVIIIMGLFFWIKVLNLILIQGILRSGGDNKFCLYNDMLCMWAIGLPITAMAAFVWQWDYWMVYGLVLVEEVTKGLLSIWRYRKGYWLKNLTVKPDSKDSVLA